MNLQKIYGVLVSRQEVLEKKCATDGRYQGKTLLRFFFKSELFLSRLFLFFIEALALFFLDAKDSFLIFTKCKKREDLPRDYSYIKHEERRRRVRLFSKLTFACLVVATAMMGSVIYYMLSGQNLIKAATNSWLQTDWSDGVDVAAIANTTNAVDGAWKKFFFKSSNVDVSTAGQVSLSAANSSIVVTSNEDFARGNVPFGLRVLDGGVTMKKQDGRPCTAASECASEVCTTSICGSWYYNVCPGIAVHVATSGSYESTSTWKTTNTLCDMPQCNSGVLVADNTIDFTAYPARNVCKNVGGRLPSRDEMACIYNNKSSLGNLYSSSSSSYYWTNTEYNATSVYTLYVYNDTESIQTKNGANYFIRCVKDVQ